MSTSLVADGLLNRVTAAVRRTPSRCRVAVAFLGANAAERLPLKHGSRLVVNLSEMAVRGGMTNPTEVLKLIQAGVDVHSVTNLHAKVFVVGKRAFIGSANVSTQAASHLIEAGIVTTNPQLVASCRRFVESLRGATVTPEEAKRLEKLFRPRKFAGGGRRTKGGGRRGPTPEHGTVWIVPLKEEKWEAVDYAQARIGRPVAQKRIRSPRWYEVDEFLQEVGRLADRFERGQRVIQITETRKAGTLVHAVGSIKNVRHYPTKRERRAIVYLQYPRGVRRISLDEFIRRLGRGSGFLRKLSTPHKRMSAEFKHRLLNNLPTRTGVK